MKKSHFVFMILFLTIALNAEEKELFGILDMPEEAIRSINDGRNLLTSTTTAAKSQKILTYSDTSIFTNQTIPVIMEYQFEDNKLTSILAYTESLVPIHEAHYLHSILLIEQYNIFKSVGAINTSFTGSQTESPGHLYIDDDPSDNFQIHQKQRGEAPYTEHTWQVMKHGSSIFGSLRIDFASSEYGSVFFMLRKL